MTGSTSRRSLHRRRQQCLLGRERDEVDKIEVGEVGDDCMDLIPVGK
jgi:hypothetical protein